MHKSLAFGTRHPMPTPDPRRSAKVPSPLAFSIVALLLLWTLLGPLRLAAQDASPAGSPTQSPPASSSSPSVDLSDEVVRDVLSDFQRGIEGHNLDRLLDTFDPDGTKDYPQIRDQFVAFFRLHENVKFRYQLLQVTSEKDVAFATADVEMDALPSDILPTEQRRTAQMRFQMKLTPKGWRLTGLKPMDFFTQ